MLIQHILHQIWGIEDPIVNKVSLDRHSLTLSLPLKGEFSLDSLSNI